MEIKTNAKTHPEATTNAEPARTSSPARLYHTERHGAERHKGKTRTPAKSSIEPGQITSQKSPLILSIQYPT